MHRNEPLIYSGKVVIMIGADAGSTVPMEYKVAQAMVANGNARWEDDDSPMPRQLAAEIGRRELEEQEKIAADAAHNEKLRLEREGATSIPDALRDSAKPFEVVKIEKDGVIHLYFATKPTNVCEFAPELLGDGHLEYGVSGIEGAAVVVLMDNGSAVYDIQEPLNSELIIGVLREYDIPDVDIPADWRERSHLANIADAKKIRRLDRNASMKKVEAEEIIEKWVSSDDPSAQNDAGRNEGEGQGKGEAVETNENGRILDGNHAPKTDDEGREAKTGEEIAKGKENEFLDQDNG